MKSHFLIPIFLLLISQFFANPVLANVTNVLIINQIRGDDKCCEGGTYELWDNVAINPHFSSLAFGWALRYDALKNPHYTKSPKNLSNSEFGLLLEVTPLFASDSDVVYKGSENGEDWYFSKNSMLIGYNTDDRKKLIDHAFKIFNQEFGHYPSFTVAWMIDAWSLNYIQNNYGVLIHEITKEQYQTDTYTLYGGIFNHPYYPSKDHPLIPGNNNNNKLNLLIVRQTQSDLLENYGSSKSFYTTQPNDYLSSKKLTTNYFNDLLNQGLEQQNDQFSLGTLGFENSFAWNSYGDEFIKQLNILKNLQNEGKVMSKVPSEYFSAYSKNFTKNEPIVLSHDFDSETNASTGVLWYFTNTYRARVVRHKDKVSITDLRIYPSLEDPYLNIPANFDRSFWIVPSIIDGSKNFETSIDQQNFLKKNIMDKDPIVSDLLTNPMQIEIGSGKTKYTINNDKSVKLQIGDNFLLLNPDEISFSNGTKAFISFNKNKYYLNEGLDKKGQVAITINNSFPLVISGDSSNWNIGYLNNTKIANLATISLNKETITIKPVSLIDNYEILLPIYQPDRSSLEIDPKRSTIYWPSNIAITGRNPIRIYFNSLNSLNTPVNINNISFLQSPSQNFRVVLPINYESRLSPWFADLYSNIPFSGKVAFSINNKIYIEKNIFFVQDCSINFLECFTNPTNLFKYLLIKLSEKLTIVDTIIKKLNI